MSIASDIRIPESLINSTPRAEMRKCTFVQSFYEEDKILFGPFNASFFLCLKGFINTGELFFPDWLILTEGVDRSFVICVEVGRLPC